MKRVHMIGIGGVGMAGLAVLLKNRGCEVSGCDLRRTPRADWLVREGVAFFEGHDPAHVASSDAVIVTPAVAPENPERRAAGERLRFRGDVLAELVGEADDSIAVCGSHGKTTTATFVAKLLLALGETVEWAIGGETGDFPVAGRRGDAAKAVLVVEADESDGTLARYRAKTLAVTNCEYDHPDHFRTPADYFACYEAARRQAACVIESPALTVPDWPELAPLAPHNRRNAATAIEVARRRGHAPEAIRAVLPQVIAVLPDRRFQRLADGVYTDYAHHPTEMACAIGMARQICRGTLRVLFQPHRHSRTKALLADFPSAFAEADEVVLCPTYAAFEPPVEGGDIADLYAACRERAIRPQTLHLARSCEEAWEHARNAMKPGDITLLLGAGDIIRLAPLVADDRAHPECVRPHRRIWIGQGTNTWRSDLRLDVDYVRTAGRADVAGATLAIPWMAGIPGTVGGWIKMNAGAFGHSISEVIEAVKVDGRWLDAADCGFAYRHSDIVGEIQDFRLKAGLDFGAETAADYLARRRRFPSGTKGSVFKNPPGDAAGRLLEAAGCKGLRVGGCVVWQGHANVIVAEPNATASDFLALARLMQRRVLFRSGVSLEPEVRGLW